MTGKEFARLTFLTKSKFCEVNRGCEETSAAELDQCPNLRDVGAEHGVIMEIDIEALNSRLYRSHRLDGSR